MSGKIIDIEGKQVRPDTIEMYNTLKVSVICGKIRDMMAPHGPLYVDPKTKKITTQNVLITEKPWANIHHELKPKSKCCSLFKDILFDRFKIHPSYCKEVCWKIVVHPLTFHDLIVLLEIFRSIKQESKVGIEQRDYIPHNYGGYMYVYEGLDGNRKIKKRVQDLINGKFNQPVEAKLKRGCTEMEDKFGPSKSWKPITEQEKKYEGYIRKHFDIPTFEGEYPDFPDYDTMQNWMHFAWSIGDRTVDTYNGGRPLQDIKIDYY